MTPRSILFTAACLLFLAVAAGAFGAHALRTRLPPDLLAVFQTAAQYHFLHALGLLAIGILWLQWPDAGRGLGWSALLLFAGIVLFSGSLYVLALTGVRAFGMVTPLGGLAMLAGWATLAFTVVRR
ncbi:MAG: DUF423 domain-containing protein [Betaproteobacteria bacterium]